MIEVDVQRAVADKKILLGELRVLAKRVALGCQFPL